MKLTTITVEGKTYIVENTRAGKVGVNVHDANEKVPLKQLASIMAQTINRAHALRAVSRVDITVQ